MKLLYSTLLFFCCCLQLLAIDAAVEVSNFKSGSEAILEVNLHIIGATLQYDSTATYLAEQKGVEVLITIYNEQNEIVGFSKYMLQSPVEDVSTIDLIDAKRYKLSDGMYEVKVAIKDLYNPSFIFDFKRKVEISYPTEKASLSSIQLLAKAEQTTIENSLVKNGVLMELIPHAYVNQKYDILKAYVEIYNTSLEIADKFYIAYGIKKGYFEEEGEPWQMKYKKLKKSELKAEVLLFDIKKLGSGNFHYVVELYTKDKELLCSMYQNFYRSNPNADIENLQESTKRNNVSYDKSFVHRIEESRLDYVLQAISPTLPPKYTSMAQELIKSNKHKSKRYLIHNYFHESYRENPERSYEKYMEIAAKVDFEFNDGFGPGFLTDRGYIYLKYGQPNDVISIEDEPSAPPYQIWLYDRLPLTNQNNVKFLFYNASLSPNAYELLHSTCRYEISNPRWELDLYSDDVSARSNQDINSTMMGDGFNRRAREFFDGDN